MHDAAGRRYTEHFHPGASGYFLHTSGQMIIFVTKNISLCCYFGVWRQADLAYIS